MFPSFQRPPNRAPALMDRSQSLAQGYFNPAGPGASCVRCNGTHGPLPFVGDIALGSVAVDAAPPCVWPACEPADCDTLRATIDALAQQQTGCSVAAGCTLLEFPICGSFGCYTTPIASDAPPDQIAALSELALIGEKLQCPGFHCGCGPMPLPYCLSGKCRQCPPDCGDSCSGLLAAILHQAKQLSYYCKTSADCVGVDSPIWGPIKLRCSSTAPFLLFAGPGLGPQPEKRRFSGFPTAYGLRPLLRVRPSKCKATCRGFDRSPDLHRAEPALLRGGGEQVGQARPARRAARCLCDQRLRGRRLWLRRTRRVRLRRRLLPADRALRRARPPASPCGRSLRPTPIHRFWRNSSLLRRFAPCGAHEYASVAHLLTP